MNKVLSGMMILMLGLTPVHANEVETMNGMVQIKSNHTVAETTRRFKTELNERGLTLFTTIDHAEGASGVGLDLRPTQLVIFGNPKVGTPLMQCSQSVAIDLPQKALIWEDEAGQVWIGYNDPDYLYTRHNLAGCEATIEIVKKALNTVTQAAAQP